ncbi:MAG: hypothetical protein A3J29_00550 [Acidobacteria bacterium RIFCSPLOWO2_12_FULL_67_14b]|nr:MAG: hypothetical protein A3J29_00550 [Acidobacteria bacterium RIFCSPLOWO2_12_FULL_67_14b]
MDAAVVETLAVDVLAGIRRHAAGRAARADKGRLDSWIEASTWYVKEKIREVRGETGDAGKMGGSLASAPSPARSAAAGLRAKIALWPVWKERDLPVDSSFARVLAHGLRAALVNGAEPDLDVVTRDELVTLEKEIDEFNPLKLSAERTNQLIRSAGADILVILHLIPGDALSVTVSVSAQEVLTGTTLAAAPPRSLAYDADVARGLGVEESLKSAAAHFLVRLPGLATIRPQGLRYQDTKVQTPFGRWFSERFLAELGRAIDGRGRGTLAIADAAVGADQAQTRGLDLVERPVASLMAGAGGGDYVLNGTYWDLGETIDMQLALTDASGRAAPWQGAIRKGSIGPALLKSLAPAAGLEVDVDRVGPIGFTIASEHGEDPVYRIGQKLVMMAQASRDSFLHCFYKQADGKIMKIFPNRAHKGGRIAGGMVVAIPSRAMGFDWMISEPAGTKQVKCFATDRDVTARLPRPVAALDFVGLPYKTLTEIGRLFRDFRDVGLAEARMVITVER